MSAFERLVASLDPDQLTERYDSMFDHSQRGDPSDLTLAALLLAARHEAIGKPRLDTPWKTSKFREQARHGDNVLNAFMNASRRLGVAEHERHKAIMRAFYADTMVILTRKAQRERLRDIMSVEYWGRFLVDDDEL